MVHNISMMNIAAPLVRSWDDHSLRKVFGPWHVCTCKSHATCSFPFVSPTLFTNFLCAWLASWWRLHMAHHAAFVLRQCPMCTKCQGLSQTTMRKHYEKYDRIEIAWFIDVFKCWLGGLIFFLQRKGHSQQNCQADRSKLIWHNYQVFLGYSGYSGFVIFMFGFEPPNFCDILRLLCRIPRRAEHGIQCMPCPAQCAEERWKKVWEPSCACFATLPCAIAIHLWCSFILWSYVGGLGHVLEPSQHSYGKLWNLNCCRFSASNPDVVLLRARGPEAEVRDFRVFWPQCN